MTEFLQMIGKRLKENGLIHFMLNRELGSDLDYGTEKYLKYWRIATEKDVEDFKRSLYIEFRTDEDILELKKSLHVEYETEVKIRSDVHMFLNEELAVVFEKDIDELVFEKGSTYLVQAIRQSLYNSDYFDCNYTIIIANISKDLF